MADPTTAGWTLPGKGQWNNQPYEYGASDWRGIPYSQRDLQGNMLTNYSNMVDQFNAARQPLQIGYPFARWAFGRGLLQGGGAGAGTGTGSGGPPVVADPPWPGTGGGLLPGGNGTSGGGVTPPHNPNVDNGFGPIVPPSQPSSSAWRNFTFQNPTTDFQKNFNALAAQNPDIAFAYGFNDPTNSNVLRSAIQQATGQDYGAGLIGLYSGQLSPNSPVWQGLGIPSNYSTGGMFGQVGNQVGWVNPQDPQNLQQSWTLPNYQSAQQPTYWWQVPALVQQTQQAWGTKGY